MCGQHSVARGVSPLQAKLNGYHAQSWIQGGFNFLAVSEISATNFKTMPLLLVACVWYLLCTTILSIGQFYVERYFARGSLRTQPPTPIQRLRQDLKGFGAKRRKSAAVA